MLNLPFSLFQNTAYMQAFLRQKVQKLRAQNFTKTERKVGKLRNTKFLDVATSKIYVNLRMIAMFDENFEIFDLILPF